MNNTESRRPWLLFTLFWLGAVSIFIAIAVPAHLASKTLGNASIISGYGLLAVMLLLGAFNTRKKVPVLPLIRARWWTATHVIGGVLALAVFFLHTHSFWPNGAYERALTLLFFVVSLSGVCGFFIQKVYPKRLTGTGVEIIFERIPAEIADIRERAEALILECIKESRSDTVARYYVETFDWYFRRPRFLLSHLTGSQAARVWLEREFDNSRNYLNDVEGGYLSRLETLADFKADIDFHYAVQRLLKGWLLVHVPAAVALLLLAVWHLIVVHIYVL